MCCLFTVLALLGPRALLFFYWLANPAAWTAAFGGTIIVPILGFLFVPWTTMSYVFVFPAGVDGGEWIVVGLGLVLDVATFGGGAFGNRDRVQSYYQS
jgi:hypothetical protein